MKRKVGKKPCKGCPFRVNSMPGWLGDNTPEAMASALLFHDEELPCHESIDYMDPAWHRKWLAGAIGQRCVGSLLMLRKHSKLPRDRDYADAVKALSDASAEAVFARIQEFITHHREAPVKSWEMG